MYRLRLLFGAGVIAATLGLLISLTAPSAEVSAKTLIQQVDAEKERLLDGIRAGQMLYLATSSYDPTAPETAPGTAWVGPQRTTGEIWMAVDDNDNYTTIASITRDKDGKALATMKLENGVQVYTWKDTGETFEVDLPLDVGLAEWLSYVWGGPPELTDSTVQKEAGELDGKTTAIFEETETITLPGQDAVTSVTRSEYVVDSPLLFKITTYGVDATGNRTLTYEDRFVRYALLPADTTIPTD